MFDDSTLRLLSNWEPISSFGEEDCLAATMAFVAAINQHLDLRAFIGDHTYNNYVPVYVYAPAELTRHVQTNEEVCTNYPCLLLYFHYFTPVAALGNSSWSETLPPNGACVCRGYGALDIPDLLNFNQIQSDLMQACIRAAMAKTPYAIESPDFFGKLAPDGFEPIERSEGVPPWNRIFHLFFQFND
jgi:hypothetical protein